jgi:hypothetical protein
MKLKVKEFVYSVKPKQTEGKIIVDSLEYSVRPKPSGVKIRKKPNTYALKHDRQTGVRIQKSKNSKILKQAD